MPTTRTGFSSLQRLRNSTDFGRVFAEALRSTDSFFTVLARPNAHGMGRLGLTISRRAAKRAVDRNRIKRIARESFRMQEQLPAWDFVVIAKPPAAESWRLALRQSLDAHFERLRRKAVVARDG